MITLTPQHFHRWFAPLLPLAAGLSIALFAAGLYLALLASPADYQQGQAVRIMYVHVPAAWMSLMLYTGLALASASYLIWKNPLSHILARSIAPVGAGITAIVLITGSIWGKPMWGAWWVWDARLTSVAVLFFLYMGYIALAHSARQEEAGRRACAILALLGFVNLPIIKFSVTWWNTLHQPASILREGGPAIDPAMMAPLMLMFAAYVLCCAWLVGARMQTFLLQQKIRRRIIDADATERYRPASENTSME